MTYIIILIISMIFVRNYKMTYLILKSGVIIIRWISMFTQISIQMLTNYIFTKCKNPVTFNYFIMNKKIKIKSHIKDLSITFQD